MSRNRFLDAFYKVNPSLDSDKQPEKKPANDNNDDNSLRESMEDIKAGFDAMKQELADVRKELSNNINQQPNNGQPADNGDNSNNGDNNEGGADNAS